MFYKKEKQSKFKLLWIAALAIVILIPLVSVGKAHAIGAQCADNLIASDVGDCSPGTLSGGKPVLDGHCYLQALSSDHSTIIWVDSDCSVAPFSTSKVVCNDGKIVSLQTDGTPDNACMNDGGYTQQTNGGTTGVCGPNTTAADCIANSQDPAEVCASDSNCSSIYGIINDVIDFLSAGVGIIVVIMIIIGGIRYATAEDDPQKISAARGIIVNALIGLVAYIFLFAFLQWLVPGGVFR